MRLLLLIATIATGYALLRGWPSEWHPFLRIPLAGLLIGFSLLVWGRPAKSPLTHARPARRPHLADLTTAAGAILLMECLFLAFFSFAPKYSEDLAETFEEVLAGEFAAPAPPPETAPGETLTTGDLVTSNWLFSGPGPRRLNKSQKVRPSNRPEVYLYPATPADARDLLSNDRFLRNFTLATYRDGAWLPQTMVPRTLRATGDRIIRPATTPGRPITYDISHQANPGRPTLAITLPDFTSITQPTLRETTPDTFRLPRSTARNRDYRYTVSSVPLDFEKLTSLIPGESPSPEYLALPEDPALRARLQNLAASFGPTSRQSLTALRDHLQSRCRYSLDVSLPEDADPVGSFLFDTRVGYCTHFASATVLLARCLGVPARLGFGWSGGRYFQGPNFFVFRAKEAHAWAEIYLQDLGWVIFETTPGSRSEGSPSLAPADEDPPFPDNYEYEDDSTLAVSTLPLLKASLWFGGFAILILALVFFIRKQRPDPESPLPGQTVLPKSPHYLTAFRQACLAADHPMPPGRTLRAHLAQIPPPGFARELLDYHYAVHYGDRPRHKASEKKFLGLIRSWEKSHAPSSRS